MGKKPGANPRLPPTQGLCAFPGLQSNPHIDSSAKVLLNLDMDTTLTAGVIAASCSRTKRSTDIPGQKKPVMCSAQPFVIKTQKPIIWRPGVKNWRRNAPQGGSDPFLTRECNRLCPAKQPSRTEAGKQVAFSFKAPFPIRQHSFRGTELRFWTRKGKAIKGERERRQNRQAKGVYMEFRSLLGRSINKQW
jgi:hypothetical protein